MNRKFVITLLVFILLGIGIVFINANRNNQTSANKLKVAVTFYPLEEFTRQIGNELVEVNTIVPPGTEPHDYEPTVQQTAEIYNSQVFIYNGAGIDPWANELAKNLTDVKTLRTTNETTIDPHTWLDPIQAASEAGFIKEILKKADNKNSQTYENNYKKYLAELIWLDRQFKMTLGNCKRKEIITSHEAFGHLAKRYGLVVHSITGISPEEEPSPGKIAEIANIVQQTGIKYIFFETLGSQEIASTIAKETGAETLVLDPLEGLSTTQRNLGEDYISVQQMNLNNLKIALQCT